MPFSIEVLQDRGYWYVTASGELDYESSPQLRMAMDRVLLQPPAACLVDLSAVDFLDSSGLGLLLSLERQSREAGRGLVLIAGEAVDRILELTRLGGVLSVAESREEAEAILVPRAGG